MTLSGGGGSPELDAGTNLDLGELRHLDLDGSREFDLECWRGKP